MNLSSVLPKTSSSSMSHQEKQKQNTVKFCIYPLLQWWTINWKTGL